MLRISLVLLLAACCLADDMNLKTHWKTFKSTFRKEFKSKQHETLKQAHWEGKVKSILKHNMEADMGVHTYKKAINEFTDLTATEVKQKLLGLKVPTNITYKYLPQTLRKSERSLPDNLDWRKLGAVTSVKSQGTCGSCWTFSVAGTMEGAWQRKTGQLVDFSEQQQLDCSASYGTQGCDGGWPNDAYKYIKDQGLGKNQCYPYQNVQQQCRSNSICTITKISDYYDVPKTEADLKQYLYDYGPISITVYVNDNFQDYSDGIFTDNTCTGQVNHAVLLVGYGVENGQKYWTVKNSWGTGFGEKGYIRMARDYNNMCSIASFASFPYI